MHVRIAGWKLGTARALGTRHMPGLVGEVACRHLSFPSRCRLPVAEAAPAAPLAMARKHG